MDFNNLATYLWLALGVLVIGSIYLIIEGYRVHKLFAESVVGRLVKTLVIVLLIELYSLGTVCYAFLFFYSAGAIVLFPIVLLWIASLGIAIFAVRSAKQEVTRLVHK